MIKAVICENRNGILRKVEDSMLEPQKALIEYVQRTVMFDYTQPTTDYILKGMREGEPDHWYYDNGATVIAVYPA